MHQFLGRKTRPKGWQSSRDPGLPFFLGKGHPFQILLQTLLEIRGQQVQGALGQVDKDRPGAGVLEQAVVRGDEAPHQQEGQSQNKGALEQGEKGSQQAVKDIQVEMVEQILQHVSQETHEPVEDHQDHREPQHLGPEETFYQGQEKSGGVQVEAGRHHQPPHQAHQHRQFLEKAPKITSQRHQDQENEDAQIQQVHKVGDSCGSAGGRSLRSTGSSRRSTWWACRYRTPNPREASCP